MFEINKNELNKKLGNIQGLVDKPFQNILFSIKENPCIKATDLATGLKQPLTSISFNSPFENHIEFCTDKKIYDIIKEIPDDTIKFKIEEDKIIIIAGKSKYKIACTPAEDFPIFPELEDGEQFKISAEEFSNYLQKVIPFAERSNILIEFSEKTSFVATNGSKLAVVTANIETGIKDKKVLIPEKATKEIIKFLAGKKEAIISIGNLLIIEADNNELIVKISENTSFPNYSKVLQTDYSRHLKMFANKDLLLKSLKTVATLSENKERKYVKLSIKDNTITLSTSSDFGTATDELDIELSPPDEHFNALDISFNCEYLITILNSVSVETPIFNFTGITNPVYVEGGEGETYIAAPVATKS